MADVSVDSLQIQIESDSSKAERSITKLATSLTNLGEALHAVGRHENAVLGVTGSLASLNGLKFDGLKTAITRLRSLSEIDFKKNGTALNSGQISRAFQDIARSAQLLNGVDVKSTGINTLINSVAKLSAQGTNAQKAGDAIREMINALTGMEQLQGIGESAQGAAKVVSTFTRLTNNMGKTDFANNIPRATEAIKGFITEMAQMTDVSDNTVRMAEALAQMAKSGAKAGAALQETSHTVRTGASSYQVAETIVNSYAEAWKTVFRLLKQIPSITLKAIKGSLNALKQLGSAGVSKLKEFASSLRSIKRESSGISNVTMNLRNLLRIALGFRGIYGVFNFLKESVTAGADVAEVNHIVEETFGDMSEELKGWASTAIDKYGIAETAAKRYAGTLSAMFQASGSAQKDASKMATDLVGLAGDLSSFFNIDTETAYNKIKSGMAGMVRPLRDLGIDLTATTLKEYALAQGITKSYASMTQAEKVMLRYQYLMDVTKKQSGDFARTQNSMANAMRRLRAYVESVKDAFGQGLVAALRHVVSALNVALRTVLRVANAFRVFMETLFGKNTSGGGIAIDTSDIEEISDDLSGADEAASGTADGLDDAADSAKKLKKELSVLPFDELNQLDKAQEKESKTTGTGGGVGVLDGLIDTGTFDGIIDQMVDEFRGNELPDAISQWAERIKSAFLDHRWEDLGHEIAWGINQGINYLYGLFDPAKADEKLNPWIDAITTTLNSMLDDIHWYELGETFANGLNIFLDKANRFFEETDWNLLGTSLADWANGLVDNIDSIELGRLFANKLNVLWNTAEGFVTDFHWDELGKKLASTSWSFISHIDFASMINTINLGLKGISTTIRNFATSFPWVSFGSLLAINANKLISGLPLEEMGASIGDFVDGVITAFNRLVDPESGVNFEELGGKIGDGLTAMMSHVKPSNIADAISGTFNSAWLLFKGFINRLNFVEIGSIIKGVIERAINNIHAYEFGETVGIFVSKIAGLVSTTFGKEDTWVGLGTKIAESINGFLLNTDFEEIANAINSIMDAIITTLETAIGQIDKGAFADALATLFKKIEWTDAFTMAAPFIALKVAAGIGAMSFDIIKSKIEAKLGEALAGLGANPVLLGIGAALAAVAGSIYLVDSSMRDMAYIGEVSDEVRTIAEECQNTAREVEAFKKGTETAIEAVKVNVETNKRLADPFLEVLESLATKTGELSEAEKDQAENAIQGLINVYPELNELISAQDTDLGSVVEKVKDYINQTERLAYADVYYERMKNAISNQVQAEEDLRKAKKESARIQGQMNYDMEQYVKLVNDYLSEHGLSDRLIDSNQTSAEAYEQAKNVVSELCLSYEELGGDIESLIERYNNHEASQTAINEVIETSKTTLDEATEAVELSTSAYEKYSEGITTAGESADTANEKMSTLGETAADTKKKADEADKANKNVGESGEKTSGIASALKTIFTGLATFLTTIGDGTPDSKSTEDAWKDFRETTQTTLGDLAKDATTEGENIADGTIQGLNNKMQDAVDAVTTVFENMLNAARDTNDSHSPSQEYYTEGENIVDGVTNAITDNSSSAVSAVETMMEEMISTFSTQVGELKSTLSNDGEDAISNGLIDSMKNAVDDNAYKVKDAVETMANDMLDVVEGMENSFYSAGETLANSVASGFKSVHIPVPHLYVSEWIRHDNSDGSWFTTPNWNVSWYKKGGLFTKATIAGFGEAGDEAALPLENKRTMGRIATAITDNMSTGYGVSKADIISAIVQAEMMNSGNKQPVIINAELRTENNETLARAVIDGMNSIDYRNNATPQFGY